MMRKGLIFLGLLIFFFFISPVSALWCNEALEYKAPIQVNNTANNLLSYHPVFCEIPIQTGMNTTFSDIELWNETNNSKIPFWIIQKADNDYSWIRFNLTNIPGNTWLNDTIFLYWGNESYISVKNGFEAFPLFDDFEDGNLYTQKNGKVIWNYMLYLGSANINEINGYLILGTPGGNPGGVMAITNNFTNVCGINNFVFEYQRQDLGSYYFTNGEGFGTGDLHWQLYYLGPYNSFIVAPHLYRFGIKSPWFSLKQQLRQIKGHVDVKITYNSVGRFQCFYKGITAKTFTSYFDYTYNWGIDKKYFFSCGSEAYNPGFYMRYYQMFVYPYLINEPSCVIGEVIEQHPEPTPTPTIKPEKPKKEKEIKILGYKIKDMGGIYTILLILFILLYCLWGAF